jgi:hypothetical protein
MAIRRRVAKRGKRGYFTIYIGEKELGGPMETAGKEVFQSGWGPMVLLNFIPQNGYNMRIGLFVADNRIIAVGDGGTTLTDLSIIAASFREGEVEVKDGKILAKSKAGYEAQSSKITSRIEITVDIRERTVSYTLERETEGMRASASGTEELGDVSEREEGAIVMTTRGGNWVLLNPKEEDVRKALLSLKSGEPRALISYPSPTS